MKYVKPHCSYEELVEIAAQRGMVIHDAKAAVRDLQRVGYYRLSGYSHVYRQLGDDGRPLDTFSPGTPWENPMALYEFDHRLRRTLLDGLQQVEIGLRVQIAHVIGKRGAFAHLDERSLDPRLCSERGRDGASCLENLRVSVARAQHDARNEDFVKHFLVKYEGHIPVWAATEFLPMGTLLRLLELMVSADKRTVAQNLRVRNWQLLQSFLLPINVLRNRCAHSSRTWNRRNIYPPRKPNPKMVDPELMHITTVNNESLYCLAAITMYLLRSLHRETRWSNDFRTCLKKFPLDTGFDPVSHMGFPTGWKDEPLWRVQG